MSADATANLAHGRFEGISIRRLRFRSSPPSLPLAARRWPVRQSAGEGPRDPSGAAGKPAASALAHRSVRKDPPFDMEYVYSTYLLERAEEAGVLVVNRPQALRDCNEKFFATRFPQCCPPLVVSRREQVLRDFQRTHKNVVFKRLDGMGGASVFRVMDGDPNLGVIIETLTAGGREQIMGQLYLPEIADGDKRILLIDGEPAPYALARLPKAGEARGNLAAGGIGEGRALTDRDRWIAAQLGPELRRRGLLFVGIDVIGDYLTEINVTCPTCIRELEEQCALDIADALLDAAARRLGGHGRRNARRRSPSRRPAGSVRKRQA